MFNFFLEFKDNSETHQAILKFSEFVINIREQFDIVNFDFNLNLNFKICIL